MESRADLSSEGFDNGPLSPQSPYAPGMRSSLQRQSSSQDTSYAANAMGPGEIQMQSFNEGLPPPPPVGHSWKRIDRWTEDNYEELFENVCEGCTQNDVNELEHELDCTLPMEVRESLQIHDGQERGGRPTGVIFGCMLLDCEEIAQEWNQWRRTNEEYLRESHSYAAPQPPLKAFAGSSASATSNHSTQSATNPNWRQDLMSRQDRQPANAVQKAYVHPAWIPLARDWGGNNICVDLAPGPTGKWGQVILMGRDYDCKYVISRSWAAFLATVADDMSTNKWFIDEDTQELKLREFKQQGVEPAYMDILRWRADQKYGGRFNGKKRPMPPLKINSGVKNEYGSLNGFSPYASPTSANDDRGRSPQRFAAHGKGPAQSSPLAKVAEEQPYGSKGPIAPIAQRPGQNVDNLVSIDSPIVPDSAASDTTETNLLRTSADSKQPMVEELKEPSTAAGAEEMRTVQI